VWQRASDIRHTLWLDMTGYCASGGDLVICDKRSLRPQNIAEPAGHCEVTGKLPGFLAFPLNKF
jgi:hypothetical protein